MRNKKMGLAVQADCCKTISTLLGAGFTLPAALDFLAVQYPRFEDKVGALRDELADGTDLVQAFAIGGFAPVVCTQVGLAGEHGNLQRALEQVSHYLHLLQQTRSKFGQLMAYPIALLGLLLIMQVGIVYWVLPQLMVAGTIGIAPQMILWCALAAVVLVVYWLTKKLTATQRYHVLRRVPLIGGLLTQYYQYEFTLGAASFMSVGHDLGAYCAYLAVLPAGPLSNVGRYIGRQLATGVAMEQALNYRLVPHGFVRLITMGQEPGRLSQSVSTYAAGLFAGMQAELTRILGLVQPLMFLVIGVQIVAMYTQLLLPLYGVVGGA